MPSSNVLDFESWQVNDLKQFLSTKGINCSIHLKKHLIKLCNLAVEINLEDQVDNSNNDYEAFDVQRRTVNGVILPNIKDIIVGGWSTDLKALPDIEIGDVFVWLLNVGWDPARLKSYKHDNGFKLATNGHVDNVKLHRFTDCYYVKCETTPETRQKAEPYQTWVLVSKEGSILSGGCACVADDGSCKHCTALLFSLCSFLERHKDRNTQVGTDVSCIWDKPRSTSRPARIQNVRIHHKDSHNEYANAGPFHTAYNPCKSIQSSERDIEKKLFQLCKDANSNSLLLQTLDPPSDNEDYEDLEIPDILHVIKEANDKGLPVNEHLQSVFHSEVISRVAANTKDQSDCDEWHRHRHGRITASNFSKVLHFRGSPTYNNYIVREIMKMDDNLSHVPAVVYGRENEIIARQLYFDGYSKKHRCAKLDSTGFNIFSGKPFMGATPDGIISCRCCGKGVVEIKCSYSHRNETPYEAAGDTSYHLFQDKVTGSAHLRPDSPWYIQIQGQLGILDLPWCDFVFYTKRGLLTDRIYFDKDLFDSIVNKCTNFFEKYLHKALLQSE